MPFVVISTYPYDIEEFVYHLDTWLWINPSYHITLSGKIMIDDILPGTPNEFILFHV